MEGKMDVAREMKLNGLSNKAIAELIQLSENEIEKLWSTNPNQVAFDSPALRRFQS